VGLPEAFLLFSAISYFVSVFLPYPATKNLKRGMERVVFTLSGSLLLAAWIVDFWAFWLVCSVVWTVNAGLSYLGYALWNVLWSDKVSDAAQMVMFCWDAAIAVCCLLMAGA